MESIVVYKFFVRVTNKRAANISLSVTYDFDDLYNLIHGELSPSVGQDWRQILPKFGKRYLNASNWFPAVSDPKIHYWIVQASKDENHAAEGTTLRVDRQFYSMPVWQNIPMPSDAHIFKNHYIGILWTKVEQVDLDWHVSGYFFSHERGKSGVDNEVKKLLKRALWWQKCEIRKIVLRKRLDEIEDELESIRFTWSIRPNGVFSAFTDNRDLNLNFTLSATSEVKLRATDLWNWKDAVRGFFLDGGESRVVINSSGNTRTLSPEIENRDGERVAFVEFDTSWRKKEFFLFEEFQTACVEYIQTHTDL